MDSELQRLRFRVRQLEREVRALRNAAQEDHADDRDVASPRISAPLARGRVLNPSVYNPPAGESVQSS